MAILKKGLAGEPVRRLQAKLGVPVDGEFGPNTEAALKKWQTDKGLSADGIAGPDTFMSMGLYELILLKQGTRGDTVKALQTKLGVGADGQFGSGTEKAVREYQKKNGLTADGLAGPGDAGAHEAVSRSDRRDGQGLAGAGIVDHRRRRGCGQERRGRRRRRRAQHLGHDQERVQVGLSGAT